MFGASHIIVGWLTSQKQRSELLKEVEMKKLFLVVMVLISVYGCTGDSPTSVTLERTGIINMFGNEPFAKLGIQTSGTQVYFIDGSEAIKQSLSKLQGCVVTVYYEDSYKTWEGVWLVVIRYHK